MVHWSGKPKGDQLYRRTRDRMLAEEKAQRKKRAWKQAVKDKLDLYGEESLNLEELELVRLFHDFFYPDQG